MAQHREELTRAREEHRAKAAAPPNLGTYWPELPPMHGPERHLGLRSGPAQTLRPNSYASAVADAEPLHGPEPAKPTAGRPQVGTVHDLGAGGITQQVLHPGPAVTWPTTTA